MNTDKIARRFANNHPELGALEEVEETEEGVLYAFQNGAFLVTAKASEPMSLATK